MSNKLYDAEELILNYTRNAEAGKDFATFLDEHIQQRVIFYATAQTDFAMLKVDLLNLKRKGYTNFSAKLDSSPFTEATAEQLRQCEIPFFYNVAIDSWDLLHSYLEQGVSDVYVTGSLAFEMEAVAAKVHEYNAKVRVIPNLLQRDGAKKIPTLKSFFIRPEDVKYYEGLVDVMELYVTKPEKIDTFYKIYEKGIWYGNIREIIFGFDFDFDSKYTVPIFGAKRVNCSKKCLKTKKCHICESVLDLAHTLEKKQYAVAPNTKKKEG